MLAVAIGWQVYNMARETRSIEESAFMLGMIGLAQFIPVFCLSLIGGQAADRYDKRRILILVNVIKFFGVLGLLATTLLYENQTLSTDRALLLMFSVAILFGCINAFAPASANALYPRLVPREILRSAIAWNSLGFQTAAIVGPAIGGFLYIAGPEVVYGTSLIMTVISGAVFSLVNEPAKKSQTHAPGLDMVLEGLRYVRSNKIVLGAISLDLVVVFFGGVVALLPVFCRDILFVGETGLGILRAATAFGAAGIAILLAIRPLSNNAGIWMLASVAVFGLCILGFGLSTYFWLSFAFLVIAGAADMVSVYIRQALIQLATPEEMRGRVSSVSFIFISASNELGEFESGVAARFLGPVGATMLGGSVAILAALLWIPLFPQLAKADKLDDIEAQK